MKITEVKGYPVWVGHRNQMLVRVETDAGIHGWGEAGFSGRELAVNGILRHYREFLIGKDPMRRGAIWQEVYRSQYFEGGRTITAALSAIDIALHDIVGKALGVPVHVLLGGAQRDRIECFTSIRGRSAGEVSERISKLRDTGWSCFRVPTINSSEPENEGLFEPRESIARSAAMCEEIRCEVGSEVTLGIDYHHRLNVAETVGFCQRMPVGTLDFIEEPIRDETPQAYESLRTMTSVPYAIGEEMASKWQFAPYLERGITNYCRLDISNAGGFTESMKVAGWAETHYIDLMPHNPLGPICTAATVHLAAAIANFAWMEVWLPEAAGVDHSNDELFPVHLERHGNVFPLPAEPGLGVDVDESVAAGGEFRFWEAPRYKRRDGSHTNW